jgi:hypothetical protein
MRLSFLELLDHERRLYFEQAAARRGLSAVVLEKDFWVCWLLGVLFRPEPGLSTQLARPAVRPPRGASSPCRQGNARPVLTPAQRVRRRLTADPADVIVPLIYDRRAAARKQRKTTRKS